LEFNVSTHLEGPWLTSTNTKKRAEKMTKSQREEFERNWHDRNKRLKEMGLPKQSFEEFLDFVHGRKTEKKTNTRGDQAHNKFETRDVQHKSKIAEAYKPGIPDLSYRTQTKRIVTPSINTSECKNNSSPNETPESVKTVPLEITRPSVWVTGPTSSKPSPTYTGTKVVGIGTMHKSNLVPIFSDQEAEDISKMRR